MHDDDMQEPEDVEAQPPEVDESVGEEEAEEVEELPLDDQVLNLMSDFVDDGIVTSFLLVFNYLDVDGDNAWGYSTFPNQAPIVNQGLAEWARNLFRYQQNEYMDQVSYEFAVAQEDEEGDLDE